MSSVFSLRNLLRSVGLAIFLFIIWRIDHASLVDVLAKASPLYLLLGVLMSLPLVLVRALRWNSIKQFLRVSTPVVYSVFLQFVGQMAFLTPGKVGELIKAFYLKGEGHSLGRSVVSIIGDRLFDLVTISLVAVVASLYFFHDFYHQYRFLVAGMATISMVAPVGLYLYRHSITSSLKDLLLVLSPSWLERKTDQLLASLKESLRRVTVPGVIFLGSISLLAFSLQVVRLFCFAKSLRMTVSLLPFAGVIAIMSISNLLPISFMGLGTRDAVFLYFFGLIGVDSEQSVALSLIVLGSLILNTLLGSLLFVIKPPELKIREYLQSVKKDGN